MKKIYKTQRMTKSKYESFLVLICIVFGFLQATAQGDPDYCEAHTDLSMDWITHITTNGAVQNINYIQNSFPTDGYVYDPNMVIEHYAGGQVGFELGMTEEFFAINAWVDVNQDFEFSGSEMIVEDFSYDKTVSGTINIDPNIPNGEYRARVRAGFTILEPLDPCGDIEYGSTLDFIIRIVDEPSCATPSNLSITHITPTSANIGWITDSSPTEYEIEYGEEGFELGEGETIVTEDNPYTLIDLDANINYSYRVRSICDTDESNWSSLITFTTACEAFDDIPYIVDLSDTEAPDLPSCMRIENFSGANNWVTYEAPGNGFDAMTFMYGWHGSLEADAWLYTQGIQLETGKEYVLTYRYGNNDESYTESLEVAIGPVATASEMTTILGSHPEINEATPQVEEIVFEVDEVGEYYIGFNALSEANQFNLYLDNISVDVYLNTPDFETTEVMLYPNPASQIVNVHSDYSMKQINVYNLIGQLLIQKEVKSTHTAIDVSNLKAGSYFVEIHNEQDKETLRLIVK